MNLDDKRIKQVMLNLMDNAHKYTPKYGEISVKLYKDNGNAIFEISDTGIGVTPKLLKDLFTPKHDFLYRTQSMKGMGIGLALSKMIVNLHGGKIWVNSDGKEVNFLFSIPIGKIE